jgi:hypothetical protein
MEIIKKENGNVELRDGGVLVWSMPQIPTEIRPIDKEERDHVKIFQADGRAEYLYVDEITETQIEPNAAVPFSGTVYDLADLMSSDFFFEVTGGGYEGDDFIDSYFYSVDVTNTDTYPFLIHTEPIPLDNAISFEVDYIGFRTDTTAIGKRQTLAKYAANDGGTISVAGTASTLTSSNYGITASIVQNGSNLELQIDGAGGDVSYNFWIKIRKINK